MNLWIRSQTKKSLIKANNIVIIDKNTIANLGSDYDLDFRIELGTYKTKERALAVLGEIQDILEQVNDPNLTILPVLVYKMP